MNHFIDFVTNTSNATKQQHLQDFLTEFISGYGLSMFTMAYLHHGNIEKQSRDFSVLSTYPLPWLEEYTHHGYASDDPVYRAGLTPGTIVSWDRSLTQYRCLKSRKVMEGAASYGLKEGIAVSFNGSAGSIVGFGYASPQARLNLSPCTRQLINAASFLVYSRLSEIGNQIPQTLHPLSDREREVLRWVALGKTKTEVAKKLVISQSTVKRHCEHIFAKLSTNSLAASVAEAIKRGELRSL